MKAIFYIDGFNFYYLRTKQQPHHKWLNLKALADIIVPAGTTVEQVNYYTAHVSGKLDSDAPRRQQLLFSALSTVPEIKIVKGNFQYEQKWAGLAKPAQAKPDGYVWTQPEPEVVKIRHTEEKGSDVNLGVHLVRDGFLGAFDVAYVLTNDTDLVEPIKIVSEELGKEVVMVAPCRYFLKGKYKVPVPSKTLFNVSNRTHYIDDHELAAAQFPRSIPRTGKKPVIRPDTWI